MAAHYLNKINRAWHFVFYFSNLNILLFLALATFFYAGMLWFASDLLNIDTLCRTCIPAGDGLHCTFSKTCNEVAAYENAQFKKVGYIESVNKFFNYLIPLPFGMLLLVFCLRAMRRSLKKAIRDKMIVMENGDCLTYTTFVQHWARHPRVKNIHISATCFLAGMMIYLVYRFYLTAWGPLMGLVAPTDIAPTDFDWTNFAVYPNDIISKANSLGFAFATMPTEIIMYVMVVLQLIIVFHFCVLFRRLHYGIPTPNGTIALKKFTKGNYKDICLFAPLTRRFTYLAVNVLMGAFIAKSHYQYMQSEYATYREFLGKYILFAEGIGKYDVHSMDTPELFISFFISVVFIACFLAPACLIVSIVGKGFHAPLKKKIYQMTTSFQLHLLLLLSILAVLPLYFPHLFIFSVLGILVCLVYPKVFGKKQKEDKNAHPANEQAVFLPQARNFVLKNLKDVNVDLLAREMGTNARTLTNWFAATDFTPHEFITHVRLAYAKEALEKEENGKLKKVQEIAEEVGYDVSTFSKKFKAVFGTTPKQYQKTVLAKTMKNA